jgi:hypothetical protein
MQEKRAVGLLQLLYVVEMACFFGEVLQKLEDKKDLRQKP